MSHEPQPVRIVDFDMPFGSMVLILVKWSVAAIPALLILGLIGFVLSFLMMLFLAILGTIVG